MISASNETRVHFADNVVEGDELTPTEANKRLALKLLEAMHSNDTAVLEAHVAPDYSQHSPNAPSSRKALFDFTAAFYQAFPDGRYEVEDMVAEGDKVAIRWKMRGTQTGPMFGLPPTGKVVEFVGMDMWRFADGKLAETWFVAVRGKTE